MFLATDRERERRREPGRVSRVCAPPLCLLRETEREIFCVHRRREKELGRVLSVLRMRVLRCLGVVRELLMLLFALGRRNQCKLEEEDGEDGARFL
jgi:hypothetical protein